MHPKKTHPHHTPFGSMVENRSWSAGNGYRFGFNGMEGDAEISGAGNRWSYNYRIHDSRQGRFLSVDPLFKEFPWNSSYAFAENQVIWAKDLEGAEAWVCIHNKENGKTNTFTLTNEGKLGSGILNVVVSATGIDAISYQSAVVTGGSDRTESNSNLYTGSIAPRIRDAVMKHRASPLQVKMSLMQFEVEAAMSEFGKEFGLAVGGLYLGATTLGGGLAVRKGAEALINASYSFGRQTMTNMTESDNIMEAMSKVNLIEVGMDAIPMAKKGKNAIRVGKEFGKNLIGQKFSFSIQHNYKEQDNIPASLNATLSTAGTLNASLINTAAKAQNLGFIGKKAQLFIDTAVDLGQKAMGNKFDENTTDNN